ncbi:Cyrochrome P450 monooxygenase [Metarhizium anisopliae]|nr:Cyrochrome P450 monooxygenase [Metarhizium anisopliae]
MSHCEQGPIIRVGPREVHINNPDFYETVYALRGKRNKDPWFTSNFAVPKSSFGTLSHDVHRSRRSLMAPYFSKARVQRIESTILAKVDKLVRRLEEFVHSQQPLKLDPVFSCLLVDIVSEYTNYKCFNYLDSPDFQPIWADTTKDLSECAMMSRNLPGVFGILACLPRRLVKQIYPKLITVMNFRADCIKEVAHMFHNTSDSKEMADVKICQEPTLFHDLLKLESSPDAEERVLHEFISIITAGTETTSNTLTAITFHVLNNIKIKQKLRDELYQAFGDGNAMTWTELEQLPYLVGEEVPKIVATATNLGYAFQTGAQLRSLHPVSARFARRGAAVAIGMASVIMHHNETSFPDSHKFMPERWTDPEERRRLSKYLVAFSKGSRQCIGRHLALANLYFTVSTMFRKFEMQLFETTEDDIKLEHDVMLPRPKLTSKGVRVIIKRPIV